jgi:hypothetical protein
MGSKKVTIGYKYYMGIHMGLARGPIDALVEISAGGKTAWKGNQTTSGVIQINQPNLFGGEKKEGGIQGPLTVMMGEPTQTPPAGLVSLLQSVGGPDVPGFRGIATLHYDGLVSAMNPYIKPWKMRIRRTTAGWDGGAWYQNKAAIALDDGNGNAIIAMNPAHIIYQCLTDRDWGGGIDRSRLNDASFKAAADALYIEGFGLCLRWNRQGSVANFIQTVIDHVGGMLLQSRFDGLLALKLIRDDYDPASLPLFTEDSGLLGIDQDDNAATDGAANEIIINYVSPIDGEQRQWRERNLAAITSARQILSQTIEYPGLPTAALAGRVAVRELIARSGHLKRVKVRLDRRGYNIQSGDVFRISSPRRGIQSMVVRAGRVEDGTLDQGGMTITAIQDVFGLPATAMSVAPPPGWTPPDRTPQPIVTRRLIEATWRDLAANFDPANLDLIAADPTPGWLGMLAAQPTGLSTGFILQTRVGSAAWEDHEEDGFAPCGLLVADMPIAATATAFALTNGINLDWLQIGDALLIDHEIVRLLTWNPVTASGTLARGCVDTVPVAHAAGARLWSLDDAAYIPTSWTRNTTVQARALTQTSSGQLDPALAGTDSLLLVARQARPYPPGNFRINASAYPTTVGGTASRIDFLGANASSIDANSVNHGGYMATQTGGEQWMWFEFARVVVIARIRLKGYADLGAPSVAAMLNGCSVQYTTDDPWGSQPVLWINTGVTISGVTDTGAAVDIVLPPVACFAIRLYKANGPVGLAGETYDSGGIFFYTSAPITVTWSHRDRMTQADQLIDTTMGNIGPEAGVTYRVRFYSPANTLRRTYANLSGTSQTYSASDESADGGPFTTLRILLDSQRDGLDSFQAHEWTVGR